MRRVGERYEGEVGMVSEGEGERRKRELGVKVRMGESEGKRERKGRREDIGVSVR